MQGMAYSQSAGPIPLHREHGQRGSSERSGLGQEKRPPQSNTTPCRLLLKEGMRLGEELGGLTPNFRV